MLGDENAMSIDSEIAAYQKMSNQNSAFNANEAQKQRDFEERMSNTAHQREVKDLVAAGLNPILSAHNGSGASTPTGVAAQADTSANSAMATSFSSKRAAEASVKAASIQAGATTAAAAIAANASMHNAKLAADAQKFSSIVNAGGNLGGSVLKLLGGAAAGGAAASTIGKVATSGGSSAAKNVVKVLGKAAGYGSLFAALGIGEYELMQLTGGIPTNLTGYMEAMNASMMSQSLTGIFANPYKGSVWSYK